MIFRDRTREGEGVGAVFAWRLLWLVAVLLTLQWHAPSFDSAQFGFYPSADEATSVAPPGQTDFLSIEARDFASSLAAKKPWNVKSGQSSGGDSYATNDGIADAFHAFSASLAVAPVDSDIPLSVSRKAFAARGPPSLS